MAQAIRRHRHRQSVRRHALGYRGDADGSAPDIAGKGAANPIAMIASFGMALRYSFDMGALADKVDAAIAAVLASGLRTADIKSEGTTSASTTQMGEAILKELQKLHA